jgi:hypothetical protein
MITAAGLQTGVFAAENGSLGIFLVNITDRPLSFAFNLAPEDYPLSAAVAYKIVKIDHTGRRMPQAESVKAPFACSGSVPGHDVVFLVIEKK